MRLRSWKPTAALRPFVSHFAIREASLGIAQIYHPLPARNDCFLEFYLKDPFRVVNVASGAIHQAPRMVLVGPHTKRREDLIHTGTLKVFHIGFTPVGFSSLFQIPARSVANLAESAECVLGRSIHQLEEQLASTSVDRWPCIAEQFLLRRLISSRPPAGLNLAARIARSLLKHRGSLPVLELAHFHGRSVRQIERVFEDHVGLSPKLFSRIARLQTALQMSRREPVLDWSALALAAGYFDQSHMVRDFRDLTGTTPADFKRLQSETLPADLSDEMSHLSYRATC
jgi:AraC-like DNA-binding protein